ncbi:MAG: ATP-binding cassette domain-containing protein [Verrucomicrobiales bacterium]
MQGIDWEIGPGENWVMVGANGCGKTSLLSSLLGYACPSDGEIALLGERFGESDWRALRCQIGVVSSAVRQMMADEEPAVESVASGRYAMIDAWGQITKRIWTRRRAS